ncbi:hypothetical protein MTO96_039361, partial [Rhipicephalus appendiculatus]
MEGGRIRTLDLPPPSLRPDQRKCRRASKRHGLLGGSDKNIELARRGPGLGYSDLAEVVADFCNGTFKITLLYDDNGTTVAAAFLRMLHAAKCVANVVDLSGGRGRKLPGDQSFEWTSDAQRKFKILLGQRVARDCRQVTPAVVGLTYPGASLRWNSAQLGGATLMLYAANESRIACTHCGLMQRKNDSFEYLPSLNGAHIIVSAINNTPYVVVDKRGHDGEYTSQMGVEISLLEAISQRLNFT